MGKRTVRTPGLYSPSHPRAFVSKAGTWEGCSRCQPFWLLCGACPCPVVPMVTGGAWKRPRYGRSHRHGGLLRPGISLLLSPPPDCRIWGSPRVKLSEGKDPRPSTELAGQPSRKESLTSPVSISMCLGGVWF